MSKILYLQQNQKVAILSGATGVTIQELKKMVPVGLPYVVINDDHLPCAEHLSNFFDALTADFDSPGQPKVHIDLDKAKEIAKNRIRAAREKFFEKNDIVIRDAMLTANQVTINTAVKERNKLKDLTKIVDNIVDIDELLEKVIEIENQ